MEWPINYPFSIKNDLWINTPKYNDIKDMKVEATLAITFAIAESNYLAAEDTAFAWIDIDYFYNKLGEAHTVEQLLNEYLKFTKQAIDSMILKMLQKNGR
jgi:hypothetical protein